MTTKPTSQPHFYHAFNDDALGTSDATDLCSKLSANSLSPGELATDAIRRVQKINGKLNAIAIEAFDHSLEEAKKTKITKAFSGIPSFIKDTDDLAGFPTRIGSSAIGTQLAKKDSAFVKQFKELGFITLGKTTTPEFGFTGTTEPLLNGPTLNPWNIKHTPGGSSGGSAALVAAGAIPIAHANDGAGSIRIPASCCGLVGLKPTRGRTAFIEGSGLLPVNILNQGVVTRSVRDTIAFYQALENAFPNKLPSLTSLPQNSGRRLKIALWTEGCDSECAQAAEKAARLLMESGHEIVPISDPFPSSFMKDFITLWCYMAFAISKIGGPITGKRFDANQLEPFTKGLGEHFRNQLLKVPGSFFRLRKFQKEYQSFFNDYDILLTPTLGSTPPEIGHLSTAIDFNIALERLFTFIPYTPYQNVSGAPALTMPISLSKEGVPIGVQFASGFGEDALLLELGLEFEKLSGWKQLYEHT